MSDVVASNISYTAWTYDYLFWINKIITFNLKSLGVKCRVISLFWILLLHLSKCNWDIYRRLNGKNYKIKIKPNVHQ